MHVLQVEGEQLGIARHWMIFEIFDEAGLKEADSLEYVRLFYQFDFLFDLVPWPKVSPCLIMFGLVKISHQLWSVIIILSAAKPSKL